MDTILRRGEPGRVFHIELFHDAEIEEAVVGRYGLADDLECSSPDYPFRRHIAFRRFCGLDFVRVGLDGMEWKLTRHEAHDPDGSNRRRVYQDEHRGPILTWEDFERYPWPDPERPEATRRLEWYSRHLPEDMCIVGSGGVGHFSEHLTWLMGYETLCFALFDNRDLVRAVADRVREIELRAMARILEFERVRMVWGGDDMGHRTGLLISPGDTREFVLPGHRALARMAHAAGRPYLLHSCGKLTDIMQDLIEDVGIDAKHSFEDTIEDIRAAKRAHGQRIALLGGMDVDFLCRSDEEAIRRRVRDTLDVCQRGGGYCLGTGNSVANYIPVDNYLTMLDEGMRYGA